MLMRLEGALGLDGLSEKLVLTPGLAATYPGKQHSPAEINLVVGYNGSPKSHAALDLTLWIAHQTRLVTQVPVIVQVVHVVERSEHLPFAPFSSAWTNDRSMAYLESPQALSMTESRSNQATATPVAPQAVSILQQAQQLAQEWGCSVNTHLRVGTVALELRRVVETTAGVLLFLGCNSAAHPIVQHLKPELFCPVLGIPDPLNLDLA